ncbi:LamG domain-containing protein [Curtobacterium aetherium]|uniref:LamG domain-containing protein n=1 Tax=Curtobacterium aetherium TaxID=2841594 RepID=A0ACD1E2H1_9MICO|nr:LamG domain-containing protein [Curtobacterium sp. L6-1]QWS32963.1 LamG domain-containing protein [Curtobacterium sp. L6-1]
MNLHRLRDGKVVALLLVVALAVVVLAVHFAPTRSAFSAKLTNGSNTAGTATYFDCSSAVDADNASALFTYKLAEAAGARTAVDDSGKGANGTYQGSMATTAAAPMACPRDSGTAYVLNGSTSFVSTPTAYRNPTTFSEEVWFRTTVAGGLLIGFGSNQVTTSGQHDRQVYLDTSGRLVFGTYNNTTQVVTSPKAYNDGAWHHVVSTMSPTTGMRLYADGVLVASNASFTAPENATGYFRVGYDTITGWPGAGNYSFAGSMRFAAVYSSVLSQTQVANRYAAGR